MTDWHFTVGLFTGAILGLFAACLCVIARRADEAAGIRDEAEE